jgi:hypothetical protein
MGETDASIAAQEALAARAQNVIRVTAAHMAQLSRPDEVAEALSTI